MKKIFPSFILIFILILAGCNNDKEILGFFDDWDKVTNEMVKKIEASDLDGARSLFDSKKDDLRSGWAKIPRSRNGSSTKIYMSSSVKKRYDESFFKNIELVTTSVSKFESQNRDDKSKIEQIQTLLKEYRELFR